MDCWDEYIRMQKAQSRYRDVLRGIASNILALEEKERVLACKKFAGWGIKIAYGEGVVYIVDNRGVPTRYIFKQNDSGERVKP